MRKVTAALSIGVTLHDGSIGVVFTYALVVTLSCTLIVKVLTYFLHRRPDVLQHLFAFERVAATPYTFTIILLPVVASFYVMAVLVQLSHTSFYRAALLPVVFWLTLRASMSLDFSWAHSSYAYLNQGLAMTMFTIAMRSTTWVFAQRPYSRLSTRKLGDDTAYDHNGNALAEGGVSISSAMWNSWNLLISFRGIGWNGPPKIYIPRSYIRVESRPVFGLLSFCWFIFLVLAFDTLGALIRSLGPDTFGAPGGDTIFDPSLAPPQRYLKSSIITLLTGLNVYIMIEARYQLPAASFTILFQQHPSQWPPLFDSPWSSTSLNSFWGRRWHQLFREYFVAVGGKPLERYFGRPGTVMGAFAISGFLHDVGVRGMGRGAHTFPVMGFFLMQGVGVVVEGAWKQATGRRVGGFLGWLWTFFWLLSWGNALVDAWARTGLLGSEFGLEAYRPSTLFLSWIFGKR